MTPASLEAFRVRMKLSKSGLSSALGCDRKTLNRYLSGETKPIPQYVALACSALAHGLPPME
jgi:predicted transcriptional regulator